MLSINLTMSHNFADLIIHVRSCSNFFCPVIGVHTREHNFDVYVAQFKNTAHRGDHPVNFSIEELKVLLRPIWEAVKPKTARIEQLAYGTTKFRFIGDHVVFVRYDETKYCVVGSAILHPIFLLQNGGQTVVAIVP